MNVTGEPESNPFVAVSVLAPAAGPSIQLPTVAIPFASVVAVKPVAVPPPEATANVTDTPLITVLSVAFLTITLGGTATAVLIVADWLFPVFMVSVSAAAGAASNTSAMRDTTHIKREIFFISDFPIVQTNRNYFIPSFDKFY